jgi:FKBP-type peptidyl-prolyl cis-trans isomerase
MRTKRCVAVIRAAMALAVLPTASVRADDVEPAPRRFTRVPASDGVQIRRYTKTEGAVPGKDDRVVVHYHGTLENGKVFDSTRQRGSPATFRLDGVIDCWKIALTRLRVGETAEIVCPADVAYGAKGSPPAIPGNARLTFEVELVGIQ